MSPTEPPKDTHQQPETDETIIHVMTSNPVQQHAVSIGPNQPSSSSSSKKGWTAVVVLLVVLVGIGAYAFSSGTPSSNSPANGTASLLTAAPAEVTITNTGFSPATISIKVGQSVNWLNTDSGPHTVSSDPYPTDNTLNGFNSQGSLATNDHFSFVFDKAGTYTYHDDLNPYSFQGTVIVK